MSRSCKLLFIPIFLLQACFFLWVSQHRFIDGDEGFYLLASRLVMQHKAPYLDFFYTQAPLLPYAYALWFKLAGISWLSARTFSALQAAVLGGLIYEHVCHETGKWMAGASAVLLFACSSLVFAWFPIVKTFPLATLFLFLAYMILARPSLSGSGWWIAIAALLFGLSVDTRSYVVALAPVFLWWILRQGSSGRQARMAWAVVGLVIGILPSLALFFASPDAFLFNNLGYHAMRSKAGLIGDWLDKLRVVAATFGGRTTGFQFSVLTLTCVGLLVSRRMKREASLLAFVIAFLLGFISTLPTPASMQYFSMLMPFLIVAAVCSVSDCLASLPTPRGLGKARAACIVGLVSFIALGIPSFRRNLFTGYNVPGLDGPADAPNWTLSQVTAVSRAIDQLASPGEPVVSFWPGYLFASHAAPYPGFESDFGMYVAWQLGPENRKKYHVLTTEAMTEILDSHRARLVVIGNQGPWVGGPDYAAAENLARKDDYVSVRQVGKTVIYQCCSQQ